MSPPELTAHSSHNHCSASLCISSRWMDTKFSEVKEGLEVVRAVEAVGSDSGKPRAVVTIADCGELL